MPQGNAGALPSGLWNRNPTTSSLPRLIWGTVRTHLLLGVVFFCVQEYRALGWKYTYPSFIGKTISLGTISTDTHEPLSTEEIDRLKEAEAERKRLVY